LKSFNRLLFDPRQFRFLDIDFQKIGLLRFNFLMGSLRDYFKFLSLGWGNKIFAERGTRDWKYDGAFFERWRESETGIPFVDAHMRELNQTGFISNRGRVNCASFLTRDYQID
jgi:hypothetical protein